MGDRSGLPLAVGSGDGEVYCNFRREKYYRQSVASLGQFQVKGMLHWTPGRSDLGKSNFSITLIL